MNEDKIMAFPKADALPECPVKVTSSAQQYCRHPSIVIDVHDRSIRCSKCDAALEAFDYLTQNGAEIQRAWADHKAMQRRVGELNESVVKLLREEKRLKALVRRLQDKTATKLDVRGGL